MTAPVKKIQTVHTVRIEEDLGFNIGGQVKHKVFGLGTVIDFEGSGAHTRVQVRFEVGIKWLVLAYANLEVG